MSHWTHFFQYFQVFFLVGDIICLVVFSVLLFLEKLSLKPEDVFHRHVEEKREGYFDELLPPPTITEL